MGNVIILCVIYMCVLFFVKVNYFSKRFIYACLVGTIIGQLIYYAIVNY